MPPPAATNTTIMMTVTILALKKDTIEPLAMFPGASARNHSKAQARAARRTVRQYDHRGLHQSGARAQASPRSDLAQLRSMKSFIRTSVFTMVAGMMLFVAPGARAQQEQMGADKPCMADAARLCPGIEPGLKQIDCLKAHKEEVSPACKKNLVQAKEQQELKKEQQQQQQQQPAPKP